MQLLDRELDGWCTHRADDLLRRLAWEVDSQRIQQQLRPQTKWLIQEFLKMVGLTPIFVRGVVSGMVHITCNRANQLRSGTYLTDGRLRESGFSKRAGSVSRRIMKCVISDGTFVILTDLDNSEVRIGKKCNLAALVVALARL